MSTFIIDLARKIFGASPEQIKSPINILRFKNHWVKENCIFVHVPKAAGTSVSQSLYGRQLRHFKAREIRRYAPREFQSLFSFALVRNPWARALSAYQFAKAGHTGVRGIKHPEQYEIPEFQSFERFLIEWLSQKNLLAIDLVFQPQSLFVCDAKGNIMLDYVGRLECMSDCEQHISNRLGREIVFPRLNVTRSTSESYHVAYKNDQMRAIVATAYAQDIETFGYTFS